jgi:oligopeptide/dipeptide ABC transporter ATP-binding protein
VSLLEVRDLTTELPVSGSYLPIVRGVSLSLDRGEVLGLVGESGSGKSMTARSILRLLPRGARLAGSVVFDGAEVLRLDAAGLREFRAHRAAMIFQDPRAHIDPLYRCGDHLDDALRIHRSMGRTAARDRSLQLLAEVGIKDPERTYRSYPDELSGGMLQRVMIAGALATDPDFLIADEPTTALDVTIQAEIMAILDELRRERHLAALFITHDLELASMICDRILVLYAGIVLEARQMDALYDLPLHPYTAGLLRARPSLQGRRERLQVIPGRPPLLGEMPEGCPFAPRCGFTEDACRVAPPLLRALGDRAFTACRRSEELVGRLAGPGTARE